MKTLEISKEDRARAISSMQRYFEDNLPEPLGDLPAGLLLNFFLEEIAPLIYNQAIADAQSRLEQRVSDLNGELFADAFQYWVKADEKRRTRRESSSPEDIKGNRVFCVAVPPKNGHSTASGELR